MDEKILYPMMAGCKSPNHRDNGDDSRIFLACTISGGGDACSGVGYMLRA